MKHPCHNREVADPVEVQDGWITIQVFDELSRTLVQTRVPRMKKIPHAMSRDCKQWDQVTGAVPKLMDPAGCVGCKWRPAPPPADMQYMRNQ